MKKKFYKNISIILTFVIILITSIKVLGNNKTSNNQELYNIKRDVLVLMLSYKDEIQGIRQEDGFIYLDMKNGKSVLYDDKKQKNYEQKIYKADLQDTLEDLYPLESINEVREEGRDPGRFRVYSFLSSVYGEGEGQVRKNLANYSTRYGNLDFNSKNKAGEMLKKSLDEGYELAKSNPKVGGFIYPTCGTFNYRVVQDTGLLSPHSFAIAIDLNKNDSDYWKWATRDKGSKRISEYPKELVKIFENNGFVWGGKWSHFDILHFEYRPEIILKAKYFAKENENGDNWWKGAPETEEVFTLVRTIDNTIK